MAVTNKVFFFAFLISGYLLCANCKTLQVPLKLNENNWTDILQGQWLVKFYAPWCPACKALKSTWEKVAGWSEDLEMKVGEVDVTETPGLSGRFLVTALPTIFHVNNGEFRVYRGGRNEDEIIAFVDEKKWQDIDIIPWWSAPSSSHMAAVSWFFKSSMFIRDTHTMITEEYGIPVWGSYVIFAIATIIVGLVLGLLIVCLCDSIFPPKHLPPVTRNQNDANTVRHYDDSNAAYESKDNESDIFDDREERRDTSEEIPGGAGDLRQRKVAPAEEDSSH